MSTYQHTKLATTSTHIPSHQHPLHFSSLAQPSVKQHQHQQKLHQQQQQHHHRQQQQQQQQQQKQKQKQQEDPFLDNDRHQKQQQKQKKKKRTHDEASSSSPVVEVVARPSVPTTAGRGKAAKGGDEAKDADDDEADDEAPLMLQHVKKKQKQAHAVPSGNAHKQSLHNKLILRLPSQQQPQGTSSATQKKKIAKPVYAHAQSQPRQPSVQQSANSHMAIQSGSNQSSPLSSVSSPKDQHISDLELHHYYTSSGSDDDSLDEDDLNLLLDDDDEDIEGLEEQFIISAREKKGLRKQQQQRKHNGNRSPSRPAYFDESNQSIDDEEDDIGAFARPAGNVSQESVLFELARLGRQAGPDEQPSALTLSDKEGPVTWSGAEDEDGDGAFGDLDQMLGLTRDESTFLLRNNPLSGDGEEAHENVIPFEQFLAGDDGDASDFSNTDDDETSSGDESFDEEQGPNAASQMGLVSEGENEHLATTRALVENGGFLFYNACTDDLASDEDDDQEEEYDSVSEFPPPGTYPINGEAADPSNAQQEVPEGIPQDEEDSGDTTDTLSDDDQLGLIRFGIESYDSDDEELGAMLSASLRDQDIGLSVSINALAERPQQVISKTAKSLGVTKEVAAKILTSVGMSLLLQQEGFDKGKRKEQRKKKARGRKLETSEQEIQPEVTSTLAVDATTHQNQSTSEVKQLHVISQPASTSYAPVLGDFAPAGDADLCVVIGARNQLPAPSPFSLRKKPRRGRRLTDASPSAPRHHQLRDQSVVSSMSSQSVLSQQPSISNSSEEQNMRRRQPYDIILELDDLVDPSMLPLGTTVSATSGEEEEEDVNLMDDAASVSTSTTLAAAAGAMQAMGDTSRWNRIPIGAFRNLGGESDNELATLASAIFSSTRNPSVVNNLSFHSGIAVAAGGVSSKRKSGRAGRKIRHIPVSPVLFPVGSSLKSISNAKSRKERRKEKKDKKKGKQAAGASIGDVAGSTALGQQDAHEQTPKAAALPQTASNASPSKHVKDPAGTEEGKSYHLNIPPSPSMQHLVHSSPSLPSNGLSHYVSPLFSGMNGGISIPPLTLT